MGELYEEIRAGFRAIDERELFVGPPQAQVDNEWSVDLDMRLVSNRADAFAAIDDIIVDGEGAPTDRRTSHYGRFARIRKEFSDSGRFSAARAVVRNPQTRDQRGTGVGTLIQDDAARRTAELFNGAYGAVLLLLQQFFTYGTETAEQRDVLRTSAARLMSTAIRPIAEVLTEMPAFGPDVPERAGPPFELYGELSISPFPPARWTVLLERLATISAEAAVLGQEVPRLGAIGETIGFVRRRIAEVAS